MHAAPRILVVDDSTAMRFAAGEYLRASAGPGLTIVEARDGDDAIGLARDHQPDVIVLDNNMPRLNGIAALPQLRQLCPSARIVMWSSSPEVRDLALRTGADAFVDKVEPISHLLTAVGLPPPHARG